MSARSLETIIKEDMGKDPFLLFTQDIAFKNAKTFEEYCTLIENVSNGKVTSTPATVQKMILGWISSNRCKTSDFENQIKAFNEGKGSKGKAGFRQNLEEYYKTNIWDFFKDKLKKCKDLESAISFIEKDSSGKLTTSESVLSKTIYAGLDAEEFSEHSFWLKWVPKRRVRKTQEEKDAEKLAAINYRTLQSKASCKQCSWKGIKNIVLFDEDCVLALGAIRCPKCQKWGSLVVDFNAFNHDLRITTTIDKNGCMSEDFVDEDLNPIPNPIINVKLNSEELKKLKSRKAKW